MRLQLIGLLAAATRGGLVAATLLAAPGIARAAEVQAAQRVTLFQEASSSNGGLTVVHPQTDVSATLASTVGIAAGYSLDIVSGATPKVFRCSGPDCIDSITSATKFSDSRHQVRGALTYLRPTADVTVGYSYGWESDYKSSAVSVTTRSDVMDHVFTLGFAYTHNFDDVCDQNNQETAGRPLERLALASSRNCFKSGAAGAGPAETATRRLSIDSFEPSLTWAVTPRLLLQGGGAAQILDGFQANPYRSVQLGMAGRTPQESLPNFRQRFALFGRAAYAFPRTRTALQAMARAYRDTWAVEALSAEFLINQYLTRFLVLSVRGRMHAQRGASFYKDAREYRLVGPNSQYWTGDRELSPMRNFLVGGKIAYLRIPETQGSSMFDEIELAAKGEGLFYRLDSPLAPNADRKLALIWQLAVSLRF